MHKPCINTKYSEYLNNTKQYSTENSFAFIFKHIIKNISFAVLSIYWWFIERCCEKILSHDSLQVRIWIYDLPDMKHEYQPLVHNVQSTHSWRMR
jgi:hypothetical protein